MYNHFVYLQQSSDVMKIMIYYSLYHPDRGVYIIMQILCFRGGGEMDTGKKIRKGRKDPVRILPDPGWFSESRTYIVRLTPKVYNKKRLLYSIEL